MNPGIKTTLSIVGIYAALIGVPAAMLLPAAYMKGVARANYIERTQGFRLPWYEAAFLEVNVSTSAVRAEVTTVAPPASYRGSSAEDTHP